MTTSDMELEQKGDSDHETEGTTKSEESTKEEVTVEENTEEATEETTGEELTTEQEEPTTEKLFFHAVLSRNYSRRNPYFQG